MADPYEVYLGSLPPGEVPGCLTVAKESHALRAVNLTVDGKANIPAILDGGSQIVAVSKALSDHLGLVYDPRITLNMESANGDVEPSVGLVRNVPCTLGNITFYLQIHVIRNPAYDLLLGRPFEVLTKTVVQNFSNGDQVITIFDPNSGSVATIPTIPRPPPLFVSEVFCSHSMN